MGHIHKYQDLNEGKHPPVVYPGSIERVDWGEAREEKYYVIAEVDKGSTDIPAPRDPRHPQICGPVASNWNRMKT